MNNSNSNDNLIIIGFLGFLFIIFSYVSFNEYLTYLCTERKYELIKLAIAKEIQIDQIQILLNSKK